MHDFLISAAAFIVLIVLMVVVHEFGHFAVAKLCKVRVEAFSIGFGPRLFGYKYGDTDYKVSLLPLGGYVKMAGEEFAELSDAAKGTATIAPTDDPGALTSHPRWQRMLIGLAGPVANFILAFGLMVVYFGWINEIPDIKTVTMEWVTPGSVAYQAGLRPGDIVRDFANVSNPDLETFNKLAKDNANRSVPMDVERNGVTIPLSLSLPASLKDDANDLAQTGMYLAFLQDPIGVKEIIDGSAAEQAGLKPGDKIVSFDGYRFHTIEPLLDFLQVGQGKPVTLTVLRNGGTLAPIIIHPSKLDGKWLLGFKREKYIDPPMRDQPMAFSEAVVESRDMCVENSMLIVQVFKKILTHKASVKQQLAGPLGIAQAAGDAATSKGWSADFSLAAGISISLGIFNLLPFPILDGGMIFFLLIESAIRRDISIVWKERIYQAAFIMLIFFAVFVTFNDASKMSFFTHMKH
jgi:regulator of sigma E protease